MSKIWLAFLVCLISFPAQANDEMEALPPEMMELLAGSGEFDGGLGDAQEIEQMLKELPPDFKLEDFMGGLPPEMMQDNPQNVENSQNEVGEVENLAIPMGDDELISFLCAENTEFPDEEMKKKVEEACKQVKKD